MRILVSIAQIPFIVWILVAGALGYMDYSAWETDVYQPMLVANQAKETELQGLVAANKRAEEFDAQRSAKLKELQTLGDQFRETSGKIPRSANIPAVLKAFADIADSIGLDISVYKPLPERPDAFVQVTPVEVKLSGTYPQIMSFLDATANMERIVHATKIEYSEAKRRGNAARLTAGINFETYSISQAAVDAAAASASANLAIPAVTSPATPAPAPTGGETK